ncbi:putative pentatricopeptide repeat-containing protein At3g05240 [Salvia hispanica]|uniref:putative pentatricopeptide repeat-containing protein At3g05240 n=1 Tax=Salvia hispanica TaxID=49212 RepID=UPI0020093B8F|nr:putative pentatricopeptide repeat-containing protein At3g05240 [Salvia hispanica]
MLNRPLHKTSSFAAQFLSLLPFCRKSQDLKALNSILILRGLIGNQSLIDHFINHCCHLGSPDLALQPFRIIQKPSLYLQNLLIRSLCDNGLFEDVILVYKKCRNSGSSSDKYTFPFVIKSCAALRDVWFGSLMHSVTLKNGFGDNLFVQTALLDFYSKIGEIRNARKVVDEIPQPDLIVWNAMISGYSVNGFDYEVIRVFRDMIIAGVKPNASTLATVFPVCSRIEADRVGVSLHGFAYKLGCMEEESLLPALISMYANCGDLLASRDIFYASRRKDVAIWNAMISAYMRNHVQENAVAVFQRMLVDEMKPDKVTFVSLLPLCESLECVGAFHSCVVKFGFKKECSIVSALVSVYAKLGDMDSAEFLFHGTRVRSLILWNSMVSAYAGHGFYEQSLEAFRLMPEDGFDPDGISVISLLKSCSQLKVALAGKSAHAFVVRRGFDGNLNVVNALLAFYVDRSEMICSFRIFDSMALKNVVTWNTMISGCVDEGDLEKAMLLFHHMREERCNFDMVTLISILPSFHVYQSSLFGSIIHGYAVRTALAGDVSLGNALVSMYINCGEIDAAWLFFNDMPQKSMVSWNAMLTGYRVHGLQKEALELFRDMIKEDIQMPSYVTLLNVLPACENVHQGKSVHGYIVRRRISLETPLVTSLMIMYARFKISKSCLILFHIGDRMSISLWNTIISANILLEKVNTVFFFFCELLRSKIEPDEITIQNLISACLHLKNMNISNSLLAYLVKEGFDRDVALVNSLIDMYAKTGSIASARRLFDSLPHKDSVSWSVMINGYGLHGHCEDALSLYSEMRLLGLKPDRITYISVLSACSHAGSVEQGRMVLGSMIHDGVMPGTEHYSCMVDLLGRAGRLEEAYEIVKTMGHQDCCGSLLASLLGACLSHENYELGEEVGRFLLDMSPKDCGPYVILHNIYAAAGKWADANDVRLLLEQNQFSKAPGISVVC